MTRRRAFGIAIGAILMLLPIAPGRHGTVPAQAAQDEACRAERPGRHDPKAEITFTVINGRNGREHGGRLFKYGQARDLMIEIRWHKITTSTRQRLELYSPDGHLYQMFPAVLSVEPDPSVFRVPVGPGSWVMSGGLAGTWCAKVFLGDDLEPIEAESFELRRR
jgi:hypothetical protein